MKNWIRYRFKTKSVEDYRPLIFNPKFPFWCSGYGEDCATIVAYLPSGEPLNKYWDDAFDIDSDEKDSIVFSDRFPKPSYFIDYLKNLNDMKEGDAVKIISIPEMDEYYMNMYNKYLLQNGKIIRVYKFGERPILIETGKYRDLLYFRTQDLELQAS